MSERSARLPAKGTLAKALVAEPSPYIYPGPGSDVAGAFTHVDEGVESAGATKPTSLRSTKLRSSAGQRSAGTQQIGRDLGA